MESKDIERIEAWFRETETVLITDPGAWNFRTKCSHEQYIALSNIVSEAKGTAMFSIQGGDPVDISGWIRF